MEPSSLFVFGLGYSAGRLARRLKAEGWAVAGTCRDDRSAEKWRAEGIGAHVFDGTAPLDRTAFEGATHVVVSIPPDGEAGDPAVRLHGDDLAASKNLVWLGYLSTTGVYGTRDGGTVDEGALLRPTSERARRRVEAERRWLALHADREVPVHVFRLAGIYGPGRSALDQVRAGTAQRIVKPGQVFSRIHVDDIANVLVASMARPNPGAVYNVCDDEPAPPAEVIAEAARLLGLAPPPEVPFAEADLSPMARSFWADTKRVDNTRMK